ncbi:hypothetical protein PIB30_080340 [Stylosanthes scabra]|uniref:Uncharacterized protein n=1 Tax=Stylosanthes scabra TaxID=79078 RepID=A0ABU6SS81_9FABA|nr:hypothetical protein [Stylosanthes scabra]
MEAPNPEHRHCSFRLPFLPVSLPAASLLRSPLTLVATMFHSSITALVSSHSSSCLQPAASPSATKTILKTDHFLGCQNNRLSPQIEGTQLSPGSSNSSILTHVTSWTSNSFLDITCRLPLLTSHPLPSATADDALHHHATANVPSIPCNSATEAIDGGVAAGADLLFAAPAIALAYWRRRKPQDHFFDVLVLGWKNTCECAHARTTIVATLHTQIDISLQYRGLDPKSTHSFGSLCVQIEPQVCYYGQHYHCFAYSYYHDLWIMFDANSFNVLCLQIGGEL